MRTLLIPVLIGVLALGTAGAVSAAPSTAAGQPANHALELGSLLAANGNLAGGSATGKVSLAGWHMTSDLAAGEAPRFARGSTASPDALEAAAWSALGSSGGSEGALNGNVAALAVMAGVLYVGGGFTDAAGIATADFIATWNGTSWSALGSNGAGNGALNSIVQDLAVQGTSVFAAGAFTNAAGIATADYVAKWSGSAWSALGSNGSGQGALNNSLRAIVASATDVFVGGNFADAANIPEADYVARWSNGAWSAIGSNGFGNGAFTGGSTVWSLAYRTTASGFYLYIGGYFLNIAGLAAADHIVRWDGDNFAALGANGVGNGALNNLVAAIELSGSEVYAGGAFDGAGGATGDYIARFDGTWHPLGSNGAGNGALSGNVHAILISGSNVYAGGDFQNAAGIATADHLAVWNGTSWAGVGSNGGGNGVFSTNVYALALASNTLYAGGAFVNIDPDNLADYIAAYGPLTSVSYKPDGRIKKGSSGTLVGNNIYNLDGTNQARSATKAIGASITFYLSIQNDATASDTFNVSGAGSTTMYSVRYYRGSTEITTAVVAGTYQTASLAPAATYQIKAVVKVKAAATAGSSVTRLVTITSVADVSKKDSIKFTVKRS